MGFKIALTILNAGRIGIAAQALGSGQLPSRARLLRYASSSAHRTIPGRRFTLTDMATRISAAARLLTPTKPPIAKPPRRLRRRGQYGSSPETAM